MPMDYRAWVKSVPAKKDPRKKGKYQLDYEVLAVGATSPVVVSTAKQIQRLLEALLDNDVATPVIIRVVRWLAVNGVNQEYLKTRLRLQMAREADEEQLGRLRLLRFELARQPLLLSRYGEEVDELYPDRQEALKKKLQFLHDQDNEPPAYVHITAKEVLELVEEHKGMLALLPYCPSLLLWLQTKGLTWPQLYGVVVAILNAQPLQSDLPGDENQPYRDAIAHLQCQLAGYSR